MCPFCLYQPFKEHRNLALQRHRQHMGNRYIEVFKAIAIDFIKVNAGNIPQVENFLGQGSHAIGKKLEKKIMTQFF